MSDNISTSVPGNIPNTITGSGYDNSVKEVVEKNLSEFNPLKFMDENPDSPSPGQVLDPQRMVNDRAAQSDVQDHIERLYAERNNQTSNREETRASVSSEDSEEDSGPDVQAGATGEEEKSIEDDGTSTLDKILSGDSGEENSEDKEPDSEDEEDPAPDVPDEPKAENFKKLREVLKTKAREAREVKQKLAEVEQELEDYRTGAKQPEVLEEKEKRIQELEEYEGLFNLKKSPEYRQKIVEPLNQIGGKLKEMANTYEIPEAALLKAIEIKNPNQLDEFLYDHFGNPVAAAQAKELVNQAQSIRAQSADYVKRPITALEELQRESQEIQARQEAERKAKITQSAKTGWKQAVYSIREEGTMLELIPGSAEHNALYVEPIQNKSAQDFGKFVTSLAEKGIKELPEDEAKFVARTILLANTAGVNHERARAAEEYILELEKTAHKTTKVARPSLSGSAGTGAISSAPKSPAAPKNAQSHAEEHLANLGFLK